MVGKQMIIRMLLGLGLKKKKNPHRVSRIYFIHFNNKQVLDLLNVTRLLKCARKCFAWLLQIFIPELSTILPYFGIWVK